MHVRDDLCECGMSMLHVCTYIWGSGGRGAAGGGTIGIF